MAFFYEKLEELLRCMAKEKERKKRSYYVFSVFLYGKCIPHSSNNLSSNQIGLNQKTKLNSPVIK